MEKKAALERMLVASSAFQPAYDAGQRFIHLVRHRDAEALEAWLDSMMEDQPSRVRDFAENLKPDKWPRLEIVWADSKYHNHELNAWIEHFQPSWRLDIVSRPPGAQGFTLLPRRWVAERTLAWNGRCRRHSKDYERRTDSSESMVRITAIRMMLRRLAPPVPIPEFHYRTAA